MRKKSASGVLDIRVNREAYLVAVRAYRWWHTAESRDAHSRFLAIRYELYAISSFLRTRDERRFTNDGL
jgi:hypothetical protein